MITGYGMCLMTNGRMERNLQHLHIGVFFFLFIYWKGSVEGNSIHYYIIIVAMEFILLQFMLLDTL